MEYILNNNYRNIRILLVEDDIQTLEKLHKMLNKVYANVVVAENGSEALVKFKDYYSKDKYFDLIISDLNMPKINGIELLEHIRIIDEFIPFIFLTAHLELDTLLKVVKLDINDYLTKPISITELIASINKTTKKKYKEEFLKKESDIIFIKDNFYWNLKTKNLHFNNSIITLTKKEVELLNELFINLNNTVSSEIIIYKLWEDCLDFETAVINLKNLISRIRKKIPELNIKNIYGLGYQIRIENERI